MSIPYKIKAHKQILKELRNGNRDFRNIAFKNGVSLTTVRNSAIENGFIKPRKYKKSLKSFLNQKLKQVILNELNEGNHDCYALAKKYKVTYSSVRSLAKRNNITLKRKKNNRKNEKRDNKILELAKAGITLADIATKMKMNINTVKSVLFKMNFKKKRDRNPIFANIRKDINEGITYTQLKEKYDQFYRADFPDFNIHEYYINKRRIVIEKLLNEGKLGHEIIDNYEFDPPIKSSSTIYKIARDNGLNKRPQLKTFKKDENNEDIEILNFIVQKRNEGLTYGKIAKKLNSLAKKTILGKDFNSINVSKKYKQHTPHIHVHKKTNAKEVNTLSEKEKEERVNKIFEELGAIEYIIPKNTNTAVCVEIDDKDVDVKITITDDNINVKGCKKYDSYYVSDNNQKIIREGEIEKSEDEINIKNLDNAFELLLHSIENGMHEEQLKSDVFSELSKIY